MPSPCLYRSNAVSYGSARHGTSDSTAAFLCTMCWHYQPENTTPKLLGSSARIICQACWRAVLDLSICWVCGEYIVHGHEVVSLGWCFWHRGCFGCLICRTRMDVEASAGWDEGALGLELEEVPLCGNCDAEMVGLTEGVVRERALETISRLDGGMSRDRLDLLEKTNGAVSWSNKRRQARSDSSEVSRITERQTPKPSTMGVVAKRSRGVNQSSDGRQRLAKDTLIDYVTYSVLLDDRAPVINPFCHKGISEDGSADLFVSCIEPEIRDSKQLEPTDEKKDVYISIDDPLNQPGFRPSRTKPIPKWMQLLPNNIHRERESKNARTRQPSGHVDILETNSDVGLRDAVHDAGTVTPIPASFISKEHNAVVSPSSTTPPMDIPISRNISQTTITFDDRRMLSRSRESSTYQSLGRKSVYMTPPEYPSPMHQRTPCPCQVTQLPTPPKDGPSTAIERLQNTFLANRPHHIHEDSSYISAKRKASQIQPSSPHGLLTRELEFQSTNPTSSKQIRRAIGCLDTPSSSQPAPSSSEYLERYRPQQVTSKSRSYVAKEPGSILARFKRQKLSRQNLKQAAAETTRMDEADERQGKAGGEEGPGMKTRTESLQKELRNLFRGE